MDAFFRTPIPWRGVLFSEKAILRLRHKQFRPTDQAASDQDISVGLNVLRYSKFIKYTAGAGWKFDFLVVKPQLKTFPTCFGYQMRSFRSSSLQDYFASSIYAILHPA
jgi:hypothetical protein